MRLLSKWDIAEITLIVIFLVIVLRTASLVVIAAQAKGCDVHELVTTR